jgi:hypothetical protein
MQLFYVIIREAKSCSMTWTACHSTNRVFLVRARTMVEFVKISKNGVLLEIKEVSDRYRDQPYVWETEK